MEVLRRAAGCKVWLSQCGRMLIDRHAVVLIQKNCEIDVQELTDTYISKIDEIFNSKEKEILTV